MNKLLIRRIDPADPNAQSMLETMERLFDAIQRRAFGLFQERGTGVGSDLDDWLRAERELLWVPPAELVEEQNQFRIRLAVPGLDPTEVEVTAMGDSIVVHAEAKGHKDQRAVRFSEFSENKLFRRFEMPEPVNPEKVQASLSRGILEITAVKASPVKQTKVAVQGA